MKKSLIILLLHFAFRVCSQSNNFDSNKLMGTEWLNPLFENCNDTLRIISEENIILYSCEHELEYKATYTQKSDTLFIDLYGYLEDNETIGLTSKYIMIVQNEELHYLFIGHLYDGEYKEIDKKYYASAKYFKRIKN